MSLSENAEEILEALWTRIEEEGKTEFHLDNLRIDTGEGGIKELSDLNLILLSDDRISLTAAGRSEAEKVVRRHRLAERLLVDVLDTEAGLLEETACKFEHLIREGIEENICVLLGHPRVCPHGSPIPKGKCCLEGYDKTKGIVAPLAQLENGQEGKIVYIHSKGRERLPKLMALGITPGMPIQVIQRFPSHVFQVGQTQIAVDEEIANEIFVLQTNSEEPSHRR